MAELLIVDDDPGTLVFLEALLAAEGWRVRTAPDGARALAALAGADPDLALLDINLPDMTGLELMDRLALSSPRTGVIFITGQATAETAVEALRRGALDYLTKPLDNDEVRLTVRRALELRRLRAENLTLRRQLKARFDFGGLVGTSRKMEEVLALVRKIAPFETSVLLTGESGTGKGLLARTIHHNSPRAEGPLVTVSCGAIPENLLESELFGHRKGAFTSAHRDKEGLFSRAQGGTLFLDEIGELPLNLQVKLLHAVQERTVTPVGATEPQAVNLRIIAATNRDLKSEIKAGRFREDLYYRLNVIEIGLPPLRERPDDILPLAKRFIHELGPRMGKEVSGVDRQAAGILLGYPWPGNIRELENTIERALILSEGALLGADDLPDHIRAQAGAGAEPGQGPGPSGTLKEAVAEFEKDLISRALAQNQGDKERTAQELGINLATLYRKLKR